MSPLRPFAPVLCLALLACGEASVTDEAAAQDWGEGTDDGFVPGVDDETEAPGKADSACTLATSFDPEFLHDPCHRKKFPSDRSRDFTCPIAHTTATPAAGVTYRPATEPIVVDAHALDGLVPAGTKITVVNIRRVNGQPVYRYLGNGTQNDAFQPWSSSKFLAVANAGANLRKLSNGRVGLDAKLVSNNVPLGDLVTVIHSYQQQRYTSNGAAAYFHDLGGRLAADALVHAAWLRRPATESFGGNYGEAPPNVGYRLLGADGTPITVARDTVSGRSNRLSTLTLAEALKRIVLHREDAATRLPGLDWKDAQVLLYGPERSSLFAGKYGGMSADRAIYVQGAVDIARVEQASRGRWRIFGKLGNGPQDLVETTYACLPVLDAAGRPVPDQGAEFVISARLGSGGANLKARDQLLESAFRQLVPRLQDGRLR